MNWVDVLVLLVFVLNLAAMVYLAVETIRLIKGRVLATVGRVRPMVDKGKRIAETGKRELDQNKDRFQALTSELKAIAETVRPDPNGAAPKMQLDYRTVMTILSVVGTLRRGLTQLKQVRNPTANPPGPAKAKKKTPPRRLGMLGLAPDIIRLARDVRKAMR